MITFGAGGGAGVVVMVGLFPVCLLFQGVHSLIVVVVLVCVSRVFELKTGDQLVTQN